MIHVHTLYFDSLRLATDGKHDNYDDSWFMNQWLVLPYLMQHWLFWSEDIVAVTDDRLCIVVPNLSPVKSFSALYTVLCRLRVLCSDVPGTMNDDNSHDSCKCFAPTPFPNAIQELLSILSYLRIFTYRSAEWKVTLFIWNYWSSKLGHSSESSKSF